MSLYKLVLAAAAAACLFAGGASAQRATYSWEHFHIHANAYGDWGKCTADWDDHSGSCTGQMEAGRFLGHTFTAGHKVFWSWDGSEVYISLHEGHPWWTLVATKPHNWFTLTVSKANFSDAAEIRLYRTGENGTAGEVDGPLFVNLSSHSNILHKGYSLDLRGYLKRYK